MLYNTINKYIPRFVAVLLAVLLAFGLAVPVFATEEIPPSAEEAGAEAGENASSEEEEPKAERITSGSCGTGLEWSFSGGVLTITGSGAMTNFPGSTMAPWYPIRAEILRVVLPEGLSSIGSLAFYDCENIVSVVIPNSVKTIGSYAFAECSGIEMLSLGSGVTSIGEAAFSDCYNIKSLRLPSSLNSIGLKAFYRCESITTVTVPQSVTSLGMSVFGYCKSLVSADIKANITVIPEFLFYGCKLLTSVTLPDTLEEISDFSFRGCDSLNTVYYAGEQLSSEEIEKMIDDSVPGFGNTGNVSDSEPVDSATSGSATLNEDGTVTQKNTTVSQGEETTVTTTVENTHPEESLEGQSSASITVVIEGEEGWKEAKEAVEEALKNYNETVAVLGSSSGSVEMTIYLTGTESIDSEFIDSMAGRNVVITIMTENGSIWKINGSDIASGSESAGFSLVYELSEGSAELSEELGTAVSFVLRFNAPAEVNAEVLIRIGPAYARQNATLFQRDGELKRLQSVVVDTNGYAHFYLASVTEETEYYIAMNLPDAEQEAIIPENMLAEYGNPEYTEPIKYEITGRSSSWGMNLGQVMGILAAVMVTVIVVVGVTMFVLNKRKLRAGYVPQFDEDEENE